MPARRWRGAVAERAAQVAGRRHVVRPERLFPGPLHPVLLQVTGGALTSYGVGVRHQWRTFSTLLGILDAEDVQVPALSMAG